MEKNKKLPIVSYSKLTTYKDCPKKYKFAYMDRLPRQDKPYTVFGQFCHEILEKFHSFYISEDDKISYENAMKKAFFQARKNWNSKLTKEQTDEAFIIMLDYINLIYSQKFPNIVGLEKKIWAPIDNKIVLYGFIDRIQIDEDGLLHIIDYKTTKDPKYLTDRTQLLLYGYSLMIEDDEINNIRTSYILLKHKMKYMSEVHNKNELIATKDKIIDYWKTIESDKVFRAAPIYYKCKGCDYINSCEEGKEIIGAKTLGKIAW